MEHVHGPAIDCDILACDNESVENQECSELVYFSVKKHIINAPLQIVENAAADQLHRNHP